MYNSLQFLLLGSIAIVSNGQKLNFHQNTCFEQKTVCACKHACQFEPNTSKLGFMEAQKLCFGNNDASITMVLAETR